MFKLAVLLVVLLIFGAGILRVLAKIFLGALSLTLSAATSVFKIFCIIWGVFFLILQKLIPFFAKHLATAATWIIAAVVTAGLIIYAAGRNFFHGESISAFIKKLIPHETHGTDFSLLLIELADSIQSDIVSKLKAQYEKITDFLKPFDSEQKN